MSKAKDDDDYKWDLDEPIEAEGPLPPGPLPDALYVWPWQAALWRAFGTIESFGSIIRRSFDQGAVMVMPPPTAQSPDALRVRAEQARRAECSRLLDKAEQEIIGLLAEGKLTALGQKPARDKSGNLMPLPEPKHQPIPATDFLNPNIAFGPQGEIETRVDMLGKLFPPFEVRGTDSDPSIPFYYNTLVSVAELRSLWGAPAAINRVGEKRSSQRLSNEKALQAWLEEKMRASPHVGPGKRRIWEEAKALYSGSKAGFDRAFSAAVLASGAAAWSTAGAKAKANR